MFRGFGVDGFGVPGSGVLGLVSLVLRVSRLSALRVQVGGFRDVGFRSALQLFRLCLYRISGLVLGLRTKDAD